MNRISVKIKHLQTTGEKAFIPFITAGYPDLDTTLQVVLELEKSGASIIELGIPFSDPLADGPTIQSSSHESIQNGTTPDAVFKCIRKIRKKSDIPLIVFSYTNMVLAYGTDKFMQSLCGAGADGLLMPDLPVEEAQEFKNIARKYGLRMIFLISPLTSPERMKMIEKFSDDFVYCVSVTGVTGERQKLFKNIKPYLKKVGSTLSKPVMVGFGIGNGEDAGKIAAMSDGVIVGSALIKIMQESKNSRSMLNKIKIFANDICNGIKNSKGN